jgi:hypothetical protein
MNETTFSPFDSVLSKGITDRDATAPLITRKEGVAGLRDAHFLEMLQDRKIREDKSHE